MIFDLLEVEVVDRRLRHGCLINLGCGVAIKHGRVLLMCR